MTMSSVFQIHGIEASPFTDHEIVKLETMIKDIYSVVEAMRPEKWRDRMSSCDVPLGTDVYVYRDDTGTERNVRMMHEFQHVLWTYYDLRKALLSGSVEMRDTACRGREQLAKVVDARQIPPGSMTGGGTGMLDDRDAYVVVASECEMFPPVWRYEPIYGWGIAMTLLANVGSAPAIVRNPARLATPPSGSTVKPNAPVPVKSTAVGIDPSHYPHKCTRCGAPAWISPMGRVDCSRTCS
jgi:hypothetical protein